MNKNLTVYAKSKQHKGHFELAIALIFNQQQPYYKVIQRLDDTNSHYSSQNVLAVLGYLYKHYKSYNIKIGLTRHNIVQLIHQLPVLHRDHWPVSSLSSSDMYNQAKQNQTTVSFNKIPSNYADNITNYKRIFNAMPFFYGGISFNYEPSRTVIMQHLARLLQSQIGYLPPTKTYLQHRANHRNYKLVINLEPKTKHDFLKICQAKHMNYQNFLHHSIVLYVQSNANLLHSDSIQLDTPTSSSVQSNSSNASLASSQASKSSKASSSVSVSHSNSESVSNHHASNVAKSKASQRTKKSSQSHKSKKA